MFWMSSSPIMKVIIPTAKSSSSKRRTTTSKGSVFHRRPDVIGFVPHVRDENPPMLRHNTVEIDQLTHIGIHAGCINQASRHTEGALAEGLLQEETHTVELVIRSRTVIHTQDTEPQVAMAHQSSDVHTGMRQAMEVLLCILPVPVNGRVAVEPREVRAPHGRRLWHHRKGRHAVLAKQLRGDALGRFHGEIGLCKDDQLRVRVHVDKTRAHNHTTRIDDLSYG